MQISNTRRLAGDGAQRKSVEQLARFARIPDLEPTIETSSFLLKLKNAVETMSCVVLSLTLSQSP